MKYQGETNFKSHVKAVWGNIKTYFQTLNLFTSLVESSILGKVRNSSMIIGQFTIRLNSAAYVQ